MAAALGAPTQVLAQTTQRKRHCPYCSRVFSKNDHFDRHIRSHTNEKPFGCKICGKFYPRRDTLLRHFKIHKTQRGSEAPSPTIDRDSLHEKYPSRSPTGSHGQESSESSNINAPVLTEEGIAAPSSSQPGQSFNANIAHDSAAPFSTDQSTTGDGLSCHAFPNVSELATNDGVLSDPDVQFDATNWLLDDSFFDMFDSGNFNWNEPRSPNHRSHLLSPSLSVSQESNRLPVVLDLRQQWYTQARNTIDELYDCYEGVRVPEQREAAPRKEIDEAYLTNMVKELDNPPRREQLPSMDFLNICIQLFFTRCNIALPLVHGPTFRPSSNHVLLILAMCSSGAMTMPGDLASRIGSTIFERALKLGLSMPWERGLSEQPHFTRDNLRGSTISQTIALLSGTPAHRAVAAAYHGTLISTARHAKLFTTFPEIDIEELVSEEHLQHLWRKWAFYEEMKRVMLILHIHDAELAALFHHEPVFRHNVTRLPIPAPAELFQAPTAATWAMKYRVHQAARPSLQEKIPCRSMMHSWATLSGIGATVCEFWHMDLLCEERTSEIEADLARWFTSVGNCCTMEDCRSVDRLEFPFCLRPLWHHTFMALSTDLDFLELAVGREGPDAAAQQIDRVRAWMASRESKRCLFHALCLQNLVASTTVDSSVGIHTPRILFSAALCWYCYILYLPWFSAQDDWVATQSMDDTFDYLLKLPEVRLLQEDKKRTRTTSRDVFAKASSDLERILAQPPAEMKASTLCVLEPTLRRLGTTGIASKFADIIQTFVIGEI